MSVSPCSDSQDLVGLLHIVFSVPSIFLAHKMLNGHFLNERGNE